ncbi:hypothetical protein QYM36_011734 [Artemia franciscana]|uniref:Uncharacterized protein n=1 Tax=Artemia franciscana TaxID=6661 RepID=A0AA88I082_ARTSF|nr:hypothetical protein QYM36_011734 [Artemia franciscana]
MYVLKYLTVECSNLLMLKRFFHDTGYEAFVRIKQDLVFCFNFQHYSGSSLRPDERYGARVFIDVGFRKWKDISELIRQHENSNRHKACTISLTQFRAIEMEAAESLASCLSKDREKEILENRQYVTALVKLQDYLDENVLRFVAMMKGNLVPIKGISSKTDHKDETLNALSFLDPEIVVENWIEIELVDNDLIYELVDNQRNDP